MLILPDRRQERTGAFAQTSTRDRTKPEGGRRDHYPGRVGETWLVAPSGDREVEATGAGPLAGRRHANRRRPGSPRRASYKLRDDPNPQRNHESGHVLGMKRTQRAVRTPRVLRIVSLASRTGQYGGPFDTATRQTIALNESGIQARLLAGYFRGNAPASTDLAPGRYVRVRRWLPSMGFVATASLRMLLTVISEVRRADVVHVSFAREVTPLWAAAVSVLLGRKLIVQPHGMLTSRSSYLHRWVDRLLVRPLFRRAVSVLALSHAESRDLTRWAEGQIPSIEEIGNPLPPGVRPVATSRSLIPEREFRVLFIARLHPRKRVIDFVQAAEAAHREGQPWRWIVIGPDEGDAAAVAEVAARIPTLEYQGGVPAAQVVDALATATIFVLPSVDEPWGNVLVSALALAIPVVVTHSAALAPLIVRSGAGIAVNEGAPQEILRAVHDLADPSRYDAASLNAARLSASEFDPESLRRRLSAIVTHASKPCAPRLGP